MIARDAGVVLEVSALDETLQEAYVMVAGKKEKAYVYPQLTGEVKPGDKVLLNTTAVDLQLGSGGYHFVMAVLEPLRINKDRLRGHIMKLRYTPCQLSVMAVEEEESPWHDAFASCGELEGVPVVAGSLHSMLIPCVCGIKANRPELRTAYVMTDGGALPLALSGAVRLLKEKGLLGGTVTVGHAFGGDYEAVNLYSGLLAAKEVLGAQVIVVMMGPGVVGTGTGWGNTGLEVGQIINAVNSLRGTSFTIPRLSFRDARSRHWGLSHHTLTALERVALAPTSLVLPELNQTQKETVLSQWRGREMGRHRLVWGRGEYGLKLAQEEGFILSSMGKSYEDDPAFFLAAAAAGSAAALAARD